MAARPTAAPIASMPPFDAAAVAINGVPPVKYTKIAPTTTTAAIPTFVSG